MKKEIEREWNGERKLGLSVRSSRLEHTAQRQVAVCSRDLPGFKWYQLSQGQSSDAFFVVIFQIPKRAGKAW